MSTQMIERKMTLWDIESQWRELAEQRFEAESIEDPAEREAAIVANNEALERLAAAELQKADGIIRFRELFTGMLDANERQRARLKARAEAIESLLARVDSATLAAMEAAGKKKILGSDGSYLSARGNGGLQPLIITDESLLPDDCVRLEGWIGLDVWRALLIAAGTNAVYAPGLKRVPDNDAIRAKLAEPCTAVTCGLPCTSGRLPSDGPREDWRICPACGGSGKNAVPGAYLGERGKHLRVA